MTIVLTKLEYDEHNIMDISGPVGGDFLAAGFAKISMPKASLEEKMPWAKDFSAGTLKLIGLSEFLGAVGLVLPIWLDILPVLTVVAAGSLALIMVLAARTHGRRKEKKEIGFNLILMIFLVAVAALRCSSVC